MSDPIDERDATIERLERAVNEERNHSAQLRKTIDELRFKVSVLEKGYAKQLADARSRSGAAEQRLADHQARLASVDSDRDRADAARASKEPRAQVERAADPRRVRGEPARKPTTPTRAPSVQPAVRKTAPSPTDSGAMHIISGEHTINDLMATSTWLQSLAPETDDSARKQPAPEAEAMIAPELVFPDGYDKEDKS